MTGRYRKRTGLFAVTTVIALSVLQLTGCGASTQMAASNSVQVATEHAAEEPEELVDPLDWTPLAESDTHPELRSSFEELTKIFTAKDGTKTGILYTDAIDYSDTTNQNKESMGTL